MVLDAKGIACNKAVCGEDKTADMRESRMMGRGGGKQRNQREVCKKRIMRWVFFSVFVFVSTVGFARWCGLSRHSV